MEVNLCDNEFRCKSELKKHKKQKHGHFVQLCRNEENEKCIYGSGGCWFRHENSEGGKSITEQNEVIQKVFGMLEKMTERILHLENYNLT